MMYPQDIEPEQTVIIDLRGLSPTMQKAQIEYMEMLGKQTFKQT